MTEAVTPTAIPIISLVGKPVLGEGVDVVGGRVVVCDEEVVF